MSSRNGNGRPPVSRRNGDLKTSAKTSVTVATIPQPHGGSLQAGNPGNSGGKPGRSGRPPSEIRKLLRGSFEQRIHVLEEIVDAAKGTPTDRTRAMELMARYGLGQEVTFTFTGFPDVQRGFDAVERVIRLNTSPVVADSMMQQITDELRKLV